MLIEQAHSRRMAHAEYQTPSLKYEFNIIPPGRGYRIAKRAIDFVVAVLGLMMVSPILALAALAVRVTGRPVLFRQTRLGESGRPFTVYKFRTMRATADPYARKPEQSSAMAVTRVGRVLRATGLDELPQLFNVLRGEMTLVGPRPEMGFIVEEYDWVQRLRLRVRPGMTGLWQISPVRLRPIHDHIEYDLFYLAHQSMILDLWIMLRTPLVLLLGRPVALDLRLIERWGKSRLAERPHRVVLDVSESDVAIVEVT